MKGQKNRLILRLLIYAFLLQACVFLIVACNDATGQNPDDPAGIRKPLFREPEFYGVNTGIYDIFMSSNSWHQEAISTGKDFSFEARVKITETATGDAMAGISFLWDEEGNGYNLGIFPNQDRWILFDTGNRSYVATVHEPAGFDLGRWYKLRATVNKDKIHIFIDDVRKSPESGYPRNGEVGKASLRIRNSNAVFDDVSLTNDQSQEVVFADNYDSQSHDWNSDETDSWTWLTEGQNGVYRGNVLMGRDTLMSRDISPKMNTHFDQLAAAGVHSVRTFFNWNDIQAEGRDSYYWDYADSLAISAIDRGMILAPSLVYAPNWAVAPERRFEMDSYAYPPIDNADYAKFVAAVVNRYKPGGELAREMGWPEDVGIVNFELGHEFNVSQVFKSNGHIFFSGWIGTLDQYLDLLKAGHDEVKSVCQDCMVLNGAVADDMPPAYPSNNLDAGGWRQYVWQGVDDLYGRIKQRHPEVQDPADLYFDILNVHTYEWYMLSGQGQLPDTYRQYDFPDPQWYRDRLTNVTNVMKYYGDGDKKIWLTETAFASGDNGDAFGGYLNEDGQADAVKMVYEEASRYPEVEKVFWWYSYDISNKVGLIREDLSVKPSYDVYSRLTGMPTD